MKVDLKQVPFSRYGQFLAISILRTEEQLWLRDIHGGDESESKLFHIIFEYDNAVYDTVNSEFLKQFNIIFEPDRLKITTKDAESFVEMIFPKDDSFRLRCNGIKVIMRAHKERYDSFYQLEKNTYEYTTYKKETRYQFNVLSGNHLIDAPWDIVGNHYIKIILDEDSDLLVTNYKVVPNATIDITRPFEEDYQTVSQEYKAWKSSLTLPLDNSDLADSFELANYILWSNTVRAEGILTEEVTYMSKNWMQNIWSWDNVFTALGLCYHSPKLAYNQFKLFIDYQHPSGAYPDYINDKFCSYSCSKPPIHAWAYHLLMDEMDYFKAEDRLTTIYQSIKSSTEFWLKHRQSKLGNLPYYTHGNDSGWDNASVFHKGVPVVSPDLAAYLIQQIDILAEWANMLGLSNESLKWNQLADNLFEDLINHLYDSSHQRFIAKTLIGEEIDVYTSAILRLPLVVHYRLEAPIVDSLVEDLEAHFESEFGILTESMSSPLFDETGYWLGPIWAPTTFIFYDALKRGGYEDFAKRVMNKFFNLVKIGGMSENYNPFTGKGNDDTSFAWPSSVFLTLIRELTKEELNE